MMLYTVQNTSMGNLEQRHITHSVHLPVDLNDTDLLKPKIPQKPSLDAQQPTQMTYMLFKFRLYNLCSSICAQIFGPRPPSYSAITALDLEISREQDAWNARYLSDSRNGSVFVHHVVHLNILYSFSHQLTLLLHRPAFTNTPV
jgi:hypothetical protein